MNDETKEQIRIVQAAINTIAMPWLDSPFSQGVILDLHSEWLGTGKLPLVYENFLYKFYKTRDKRTIQKKLQFDKEIPVWDPYQKKVVVMRPQKLFA